MIPSTTGPTRRCEVCTAERPDDGPCPGCGAAAIEDGYQPGLGSEEGRVHSISDLPERTAPPAPPTAALLPQPVKKPLLKPLRPPVLASESLREDMAPKEPGRAGMRIAAAGLGVLGALAAVAADAGAFTSLFVGGALVALAVIGLAPLAYATRARAVFSLATAGFLGVSLLEIGTAPWTLHPLIGLAVVVLGGSLLFRASYRASRLARAGVAFGILLGAIWLHASGALSHLIVLSSAWQSWLPHISAAALLLLLIASLSAYMNETSTGACEVWGRALCVWYGAACVIAFVARVFPADPLRSIPVHGTFALASLTAPVFTALACAALAQLFVIYARSPEAADRPSP